MPSPVYALPLYPVFHDLSGLPLDAGFIWVGQPGQSAQAVPLQVFWDEALTQPAAQPIRTINGYPSRNGSPAAIYVSGDYSITVRDSAQRLVYTALEGVNFAEAATADAQDAADRAEAAAEAVENVANSTVNRSTVYFSGAGTNAELTLPLAVVSKQQLTVTVNNLALPRSAYNVSGTQLTPVAPVVWPIGTNNIEVSVDGITTITPSIDYAFTSRAALVAALPLGLPSGSTVSAAGLLYVVSTGATAIPDMPGMLPAAPVYVDHFGATRNTAQASAAMAYANTAGAELLLGTGTYEWLNVIAPANGRLSLKGVRGATIVRVPNGSDGQCLGRSAGAGSTDFITLEDIIFDGNKANDAGVTAASAVAFSGVGYFYARGCTFRNSSGYGFGLQAFAGSGGATGPQTNILLEDCHALNNGDGVGGTQYDGFDIKDADQITFIACTANGNTLEGFDVRGRSVTFTACQSDSNGGAGFQLSVNPAAAQIGQIEMAHCTASGNGVRNLDIIITETSSPLIYVNVYGGDFTGGPEGARVRADGDKFGAVRFFGTIFRGHTGDGIGLPSGDLSRVELHGVSCIGNGANGVITGGSRLRIIGGTFTGNSQYGIAESSTGTRTMVSKADVRGNTVGAILDRGLMVVDETLGYQTEANLTTGAASLATAGTATITVAHGLPFTPNRNFIGSTLNSLSDNAAQVTNIRATATDATNVTVAYNVVVPAVGATATFNVRINKREVA